MATVTTNSDAAGILFDVASILEIAEDNPYRVRAYRRAAHLMLRYPGDARVRLNPRGELDLPGLGIRLRRKLGELLTTGKMGVYIELCAETAPEIEELLHIPSVGPKTALRLHEELGLTNAADVYEAARTHRIRLLYGFGDRREQHILNGAREVLAGRPKRPSMLAAPAEDELPAPTPIGSIRPRQIHQLSLPAAA